MVAANPTREAVEANSLAEEVQNGGAGVVIANADAGDEAGFAINEAMYDNLEANETWDEVSVLVI